MASHHTRAPLTMASVVRIPSVVLAALTVLLGVGNAAAGSLNFTNSCAYTVWPGITSSGASSAAPEATGFELKPGESEIVAVPSGWSGRVWGRTLCSTDSGGRFSCVTGDCGTGRQDCTGGNAAPPVTLAQFTMDDGSRGMDLYDISLVNGYNLPMLVAPPQGAAPGTPAGCVLDLNGECPAELRVMSGTAAVACKSACQAFGSPQYCCTGEYGNPETCKPSAYSQLFKNACPLASSYAYDGADSIFTCGGGGDTCTYTISFCPRTTSEEPSTSTSNPSQPPPGAGNMPPIDGGITAYTGGSQQVAAGAAASAPWRVVLIVAVMGMVTAALGLLAKFLGLFKLCCNQSATAGADV